MMAQKQTGGFRPVLWLVLAVSVTRAAAVAADVDAPAGKVWNAGFVCTPGVYNTELVAPYDVLQHSIYRDADNYIRCFIVTENGEPFVSAEGVTIQAHYSFDDAPAIDILLIPSSENSMDADLQNVRFIEWLRTTVARASWVITLCDGAFPLAATGVLDGRVATTFPGDRDRFQEMFPKVDVRYDVNFVVDGKYITSVGGAPSFEPAFWLVEKLYSKAHAERTGQGLVYEWNIDDVQHLVVER